MTKIYMFTCLLSALTLVEMEPINRNGRVGTNLSIICSEWKAWTFVKDKVKYFCRSPCKNKHIIVKADYGTTVRKNQIEITNNEHGLNVTFYNLQKSDSGKYYCGVERYGYDKLLEVNVKVTDAESFSPKKDPKLADAAVTTSPSTSSNGPTVYTSTPVPSRTQGAGEATLSDNTFKGNVLYWTVGSIGLITLVMAVVILTKRTMRNRQMDVIMSQEPVRESGDPEGVYQSLNPVTADKDQVYSTISPTERKGSRA